MTMKILNACRLFWFATMAAVLLAQSAPTEEKDKKAATEREDSMAWVKVSKEQGAAAGKFGVPVAMTNSIGMRFVLIPPGTFQMGSADSAEEVRAKCIGVTANPDWAEDEHPVHEVTFTRPFYMGIHEVDAKRLEMVAPRPSETKEQKTANQKRRRGDPRARTPIPALNVWWPEAVQFCEELSQREGRTYRLPTEAEWEYACRAGTTTPFHYGEIMFTNQVNCNCYFPYGEKAKATDSWDRRRKAMQPGSFPPNAWGLHDMHGNVAEWCADWYGAYSAEEQADPKGPSSGTERVVRGGSWYNSPAVCRSAKRAANAPTDSAGGIGFRVVVEPVAHAIGLRP